MPEHYFQPVGQQARWRVAYGLLRKTPVGHVLAYQEVADALRLDVKADRTLLHGTLRRAAEELLREDKRASEAVRGRGYRVVSADQHVELARERQRRAQREIAVGHQMVQNVDFNELSPEGQRLATLTAQAFAAQRDFMRRLDVRQNDLEDAFAAVSTRQERTEDEVQRMKERLAWLEEQQAGREKG